VSELADTGNDDTERSAGGGSDDEEEEDAEVSTEGLSGGKKDHSAGKYRVQVLMDTPGDDEGDSVCPVSGSAQLLVKGYYFTHTPNAACVGFTAAAQTTAKG
jgi:hypothetical protein